jgi:hypothetical protein
VDRIHLFQTPSYRRLISWLLDVESPPLRLPNGNTVSHLSTQQVVYMTKAMTWQEWFALFPVLPKDMFDLKALHETDKMAVAGYDDDFKMVCCFSREQRLTPNQDGTLALVTKNK